MNDRSRTPEARLLLGLGVSLWLVAALSAGWEVLALQPPDSPLHAGVLAGPIAQLSTFAFALGCVLALVAVAWPNFYQAGEGRAVAWLLALGAVLHVAVLWVAAARGLMAVQLLDPRGDARALLYARGGALTLSVAGLLGFGARVLRAR